MANFIRKNVIIYQADEVDKFNENILQTRKPAILRGINIGPCVEKWSNVEYLANKIGDKIVKIHVCADCQMDFLRKNFLYRSLPFREFIKRSSSKEPLKEFFQINTEKYYLRALGDNPRKDKADFKTDFHEIAEDIQFPDLFEKENYFSSVFRVASAGVQLWTHYDIMDNILIQVVSKKTVVLFPPNDVEYLYMEKDKSLVLDVFNHNLEKYPLFIKAKRYECELLPGDILFIPALWFHNVISHDFGVAVNVFWLHLNKNYYEQNDTYGNKDLIAAKNAFDKVNRAINDLKILPDTYKQFYAKRLIEDIKNKLLQ